MEFELDEGTPVLAPIDMMLVGFDNRNARFRIGPGGERMAPFDDLELCFESADPAWPGMAVCVYHLSGSPLLTGHNVDAGCGAVDEWQGTIQAEGHLFYEYRDRHMGASTSSGTCGGQIGRRVSRGEVIGYAGSVGDHSVAPFRFKVRDGSVNALVERGDEHLHWVQPGSFFYWRCFAPGEERQPGVLAYPFACGGYAVPVEQQPSTFKVAPEG